MSGISSLAPSKHSSSSHSLASVSFTILQLFLQHFCSSFHFRPHVSDVALCVCVFPVQMRVPSSPNQSANPSTPWEAEPVVEESGAVEDANAENLYIMGRFQLQLTLKNV